MNSNSFLLNFFAQTDSEHQRKASHCESDEQDNHKSCSSATIDIWEFLILLQRLLVLLYRILKKFKILKIIHTLL
jgi:hypothetical protein